MQEWFEEWFDSPYYHMLYKNRNDDEANEFVRRIVSHFKLDKSHTLLDLACGKGRHARAFASYGIDVTGLDLSKNSIEFATSFEHQFLHFFVHDMRQTFRANYFDIICNLFTSFGYFKTAHDNDLAVRSMYQSVKKGGRVLIDFVNRQPAIQQIEAKRNESIQHDGVQFEVRRSYTRERFLKEIDIKDGDQSYHFEESLNSFSFEQLNNIFLKAGFTLNESFGNYALDAYDENSSPRMILVYSK